MYKLLVVICLQHSVSFNKHGVLCIKKTLPISIAAMGISLHLVPDPHHPLPIKKTRIQKHVIVVRFTASPVRIEEIDGLEKIEILPRSFMKITQ